MTSIRRRTAALVALGMTLLLLIGGIVLLLVLRRAITAQFDEALVVRAAALQSLTRFDGDGVELDFTGEAMPRYARSDDAEFFIIWAEDGLDWRELDRSESLSDTPWPPVALCDSAVGVRDTPLPDGASGRMVLIEFIAPLEHEDETEHTAATPDPLESTGSSPAVRLMVAISRAPLDRTLSLIGWYIAGAGVALALASITASYWAVRHGLVPLHSLSRQVEAIGPDTLATRFKSGDFPEELRPITTQLSGLLARLDEAFEREKRFGAAASHELRTPIAELRMLLEVADSQPRTSEEWSQTCATALDVLSRAQALCETLLRLSKAGTVHAPSDPHASVDLAPILSAQSTRAIAMHTASPPLMKIHCDPGLVARTDQATLSAIIANLLDNALRHGTATHDDPITIHANATDGLIRIQITNPTPSLTASDLLNLFEPFWRKDVSRHDQRGFGLGLSVARTLAQSVGERGDLTARFSAGHITLELTMPAA